MMDQIATFTAQGRDGEIVLRWRTESEMDNLGFHIYRATEESGPYLRLTAEVIAGQGSSALAYSYTFTDRHATNGVQYYYKLEDIAFDGAKTMHGPVSGKAVALVGRTNWGHIKALMETQ